MKCHICLVKESLKSPYYIKENNILWICCRICFAISNDLKDMRSDIKEDINNQNSTKKRGNTTALVLIVKDTL